MAPIQERTADRATPTSLSFLTSRVYPARIDNTPPSFGIVGRLRHLAGALMVTGLFACASQAHPWDDKALGPDARTNLVLRAMTEDEKLRLVHGYFAGLTPPGNLDYRPPAEAIIGSAGYVPGIPRLGIPPLWETDAGLGVANQPATGAPRREATSLPSGLATAATWNPERAYQSGRMIGAEARAYGFNLVLAGGVNLTREPTGGRNFEYAGEDPLLAGVMVGEAIRGIQSNHLISTVKHWALNVQEDGRKVANAVIPLDQARMSDLLAFEIAIERGAPGSVMCALNRFNGPYACENPVLLDQVLKQDWGYQGFVMSDWGAVHSTVAAVNAGLDQESATVFDRRAFFAAPLKAALDSGQVTPARLDDMAGRIVHSMFACGVIDDPVSAHPLDFKADAVVTQEDAEESLVLLKNDGGLLPLPTSLRRVAVIGAHADAGVMAGGGSSTVHPVGGNAVPGLGPQHWPGPVMFDPSAPLDALRARLPGAEVGYAGGEDITAAVALAARSDVVLLFVQHWNSEAEDAPIALPGPQDVLVAAVAAANPRTVVVVESGGAVLMPWREKVGAIVEAWYPGTRGGEAVGRVLFGEVDASGRLPITFPSSVDQLPRPHLGGQPDPNQNTFDVTYSEGAAVGYKWYDSRVLEPLFPFGYGLSYTQFAYSNLHVVAGDDGVTASFTVRNVGSRSGKAVPQLYVGPAAIGWEAPRRLAGWQKLTLRPGEARTMTLRVDPRLLAVFNAPANSWRIAAGDYRFWLGASSRDLRDTATLRLSAASVPVAGPDARRRGR